MLVPWIIANQNWIITAKNFLQCTHITHHDYATTQHTMLRLLLYIKLCVIVYSQQTAHKSLRQSINHCLGPLHDSACSFPPPPPPPASLSLSFCQPRSLKFCQTLWKKRKGWMMPWKKLLGSTMGSACMCVQIKLDLMRVRWCLLWTSRQLAQASCLPKDLLHR